MNNNNGLMIPPNSVEAEQSVLGGLLIDNDSIDRMGELEESSFFNNSNRLIYRAIRKQAADGKAFDVITVAELLEGHGKLDAAGGFEYIGSLAQNVPSSANIGHYAEIVREHATRRAIMVVAAELTEMVVNRVDVSEAMDKVQARLLAITEGVDSDEPKTIGSILREHMDTISHRLSNDRKGITTGLLDLDKILNGGWHRGQLVVIAGRPGMGKSALSLHNSIEAAIAGHGVLYVSMEMVSAELADRALSSYGKIALGKILTAELGEDGWDGISTAISKLGDLPLSVIDRSGLNFYQVSSYARRYKRKSGLDVLVVDYLQLMAGEDADKRHSQIEEITRGLKALAKELNIAILLLSQLSRKTDNARRPKLSDLRDSSSVEQDCDVCIAIHREEVDSPGTNWKGYADLYVLKNRQGALGRVGVTYIGEQIRFESFSGVPPNWEENNQVYKKRGMM